MTRGLVGGDGPVAWQRAAVGLAFGCVVLLVIPLYLLAREIFGDGSAWLGCLLVMANPLLGGIVANVLSESSFLLFWTWGLWAAVRFLREGRFVWLPLTLVFGVLSYLSRPEGLLLPMAIVAALALLPLSSSTRINWPRWWGAVAFLLLGLIFLAGPYMVVKGSPGTKPGIARVLGLAPVSPPDALERERPLPADQTVLETYRLATERMFRVIRGVVWTPLLPLSAIGLLTDRTGPRGANLAHRGRGPCGVGGGACAVTRHDGLLHGPPWPHSRHAAAARRRSWRNLAGRTAVHPRQVARAPAAASQPRPRGLGRAPRDDSHCSANPRIGTGSPWPFSRLSRCRRLAGGELP